MISEVGPSDVLIWVATFLLRQSLVWIPRLSCGTGGTSHILHPSLVFSITVLCLCSSWYSTNKTGRFALGGRPYFLCWKGKQLEGIQSCWYDTVPDVKNEESIWNFFFWESFCLAKSCFSFWCRKLDKIVPNLKSQMRYPCKHYLHTINHQEYLANFVTYH